MINDKQKHNFNFNARPYDPIAFVPTCRWCGCKWVKEIKDNPQETEECKPNPKLMEIYNRGH